MIATQTGSNSAPRTLVINPDLTLDQLADSINNLIKQGNAHQYQIGQYYNYIVEKGLAEANGYKSARDFFSKKVKALSQATLSAYGTVARSFPETVATQYGMFNLRALLTYADASGTVVPAGDPGPMIIDVPQEDETVKKTPFADCTVDDIERATRARRNPPRPQIPTPDAARILFIKESFKRHFTGVADISLTSRNEEGKTLVNVQNVPLSELTRLVTALQEGINAKPSAAAQ